MKPFILTLTLVAASCGGESSSTEAHGAGGTSGASAAGTGAGAVSGAIAGGSDSGAGAGAGGTFGGTGGAQSASGSGGANAAGGPPTCPETAPLYVTPCSLESAGLECEYQFDCQSRTTQTFRLRCDGKSWSMLPGIGCTAGDFCNAGRYQLQCVVRGWQIGGAGEAGFCAEERVPNGSSCYRSSIDSTAACGYFCPDGTWTVGFCSAGKPGEQIYEFTPPCAGEELASAGAAGAN